MGIEGAVRLGLRKQLEAIEDPAQREQLFQAAVRETYDRGTAISMASDVAIDGVSDPADTRAWIVRGVKSVPPRHGERRRFLDTW